MKRKSNYWQCAKPSSGTRWAYTEMATVIDDPNVIESVFRMHRRYAKQWNDIELDTNRSLSEHTHKVHGAQVVSGNRRFILHGQNGEKTHWILEVLLARGFAEWHPGWSFGKNPLRTISDIKSIHLHWSEGGKESFEEWLIEEREINSKNGECGEYRSGAKTIKV